MEEDPIAIPSFSILEAESTTISHHLMRSWILWQRLPIGFFLERVITLWISKNTPPRITIITLGVNAPDTRLRRLTHFERQGDLPPTGCARGRTDCSPF